MQGEEFTMRSSLVNRATKNSVRARGLAVCTFTLLALAACRKEPSASPPTEPNTPAPPDLTRCTRLEAEFLPSILESEFRLNEEIMIFSEEDLRLIKSWQSFVVEEATRINVFAQSIAQATHVGGQWPAVDGVGGLQVICYSGSEKLATLLFKVKSVFIVDGKERFAVHPDGQIADFHGLYMAHLWPFTARQECAYNLRGIYYRTFRVSGGGAKPYPNPDDWCEAVLVDFGSPDRAKDQLLGAFRCPSVGKGASHYAMNPNCTAGSPPEMVLLFETRESWNPHGGPELFTFDNHNPKGGCVLLNDGTVKFIRTEEELRELRWK
jgi:hypothetical protein